jgi:hypothetical protein
MKLIGALQALLLLILIAVPLTALDTGIMDGTPNMDGVRCFRNFQFQNCPHCGPGVGFQADSTKPQPFEYSDIVLKDCDGHTLTPLLCARLCECNDGKLYCWGTSKCGGVDVTEHCRCIFDGKNCKDGSYNKKTDDGGVCFCPNYWTVGSPLVLCPVDNDKVPVCNGPTVTVTDIVFASATALSTKMP